MAPTVQPTCTLVNPGALYIFLRSCNREKRNRAQLPLNRNTHCTDVVHNMYSFMPRSWTSTMLVHQYVQHMEAMGHVLWRANSFLHMVTAHWLLLTMHPQHTYNSSLALGTGPYSSMAVAFFHGHTTPTQMLQLTLLHPSLQHQHAAFTTGTCLPPSTLFHNTWTSQFLSTSVSHLDNLLSVQQLHATNTFLTIFISYRNQQLSLWLLSTHTPYECTWAAQTQQAIVQCDATQEPQRPPLHRTRVEGTPRTLLWRPCCTPACAAPLWNVEGLATGDTGRVSTALVCTAAVHV